MVKGGIGMTSFRFRQLVTIFVAMVFYLTLFQAIPAHAKSEIVKTTMYSNGYRFSPPITITTARFYGPQVKFKSGDSIDNNVWTKAYEAYCGIKLKSLFISTDFNSFDKAVTSRIASDSLPDILPVYGSMFYRIADQGKAYNLKSMFDKYLDTSLKTMMQTYDGGRAYKASYRNKMLAGIASPPSKSPSMLWIRQDWLDKYGLEWPKTITEALNIAKTFCIKNPGAPTSKQTYAFPLTQSLEEITGLANAYGAYRHIWIYDSKGGLMRSEVSPKWKTVLKLLSDMYEQGQLDPEFVLQHNSTINQGMINQQFGMYFGSAGSPVSILENSLSKDPNARWKQGYLTDTTGKSAKMQVRTQIQSFYVVSKKSKYPEAVMFLANIYGDLANGIGAKYRKYNDFIASDKRSYDSFWYPLVDMSYPKTNTKSMIANAIKTDDDSKLMGSQLNIFEKYNAWTQKKISSAWGMWAIFKPDGSYDTESKILSNNLIVFDKGWGKDSPTWSVKGPELWWNSDIYFSKIIRGDISVEDGFSQWLAYFKHNGGAIATAEMNKWWWKYGKAGFR